MAMYEVKFLYQESRYSGSLYDYKLLQGLHQKNISDILNSRLQQLLEKTIPYNLNINHVNGHTNGICDYKSRFHAKKTEAQEIVI